MFVIFKITLCLTAGVYLIIEGAKMIAKLFGK